METYLHPSPYYSGEIPQQLAQTFDNENFELEEIPAEFSDRAGVEITLLGKSINMRANRIRRSSELSFPGQFDNFNRFGSTSVRITEATLNQEDGARLGRSVYIELQRPLGNHHLVQIMDDDQGEATAVVYDEDNRPVTPNPETDDLLDGLVSWGLETATQAEHRSALAQGIFNAFNGINEWKKEYNPPPRDFKVYISGRPDFSTRAVLLQRTGSRPMMGFSDTLKSAGAPCRTNFDLIKETYKDGGVDLSIEITRSTGHNHLLVLSKPAESDETDMKVFNAERRPVELDEAMDEFLASLLSWSQKTRT